MSRIADTFKPDYVLIPIGGVYTMDPNQAETAIAKYFSGSKFVIPMHYGTIAALTGTFSEFKEAWSKSRPKS
jgi:L-ascorbate metabolism protein UlaG (beta-lactamase superfamily)